MKLSLVIAASALSCATAFAHVAAEPSSTTTGNYTQIAFRVGHGCDGKATTALRIQIPSALTEVRARPVPGWQISVAKGQNGKTETITWRGQLPDEQFEVYELFFQAPKEATVLNFDVFQVCGSEELKWNSTVKVTAGSGDTHAGHH